MHQWQAIIFTVQLFNLKTSIVHGIVNLHQETANPIFYRRIAPELSEHAWKAGISCLEDVSRLFFVKRENSSRSDNVVIGSVVNLSTPAAEVQDGFLELMNKIVDKYEAKDLYQLRVISDKESYNSKQAGSQRALLLADYYAIITDSVERLIDLIDKSISRMSSWNPGARFLVLYNNIESHQAEKTITMKIYTDMLEKFYIHRIAILFATNAFDYSLTSLDYFSREACRRVISHRFGACKNGSLEHGYEYVKKRMEELQGHKDAYNCTFNACASIAAPFVEQDCKTGLELRVIGGIRKRLRLNVNVKCNRTSRGVQSKTNKEMWTGWLGSLQQGKCDFIVGGYYPDNDVISHFWASECYFNDKHTWFIKRAGERPEWMALYSIFDQQVWMCFLLMLPITWFAWYLLTRPIPEPKSHKECSLLGINNMALTICVAVNERPVCHTVRIFWFALSLYGMNIVSIYTSRLISVFANPGYLHQIDNLDEVIKVRIPFGGSEESHDWFDNDDDEWINVRYQDSELFIPNTANLQAVAEGQRVILSGSMYVMQHNVSDKVYAFPQTVFSSPLQMIMKPGFPYMYEINWLIRSMRDSGIFAKYYVDFKYNNTYLNRIAKMRPEFVETVIVITTNHLEGCFALLILGLSSGCLVFCLEMCTRKRQRIKKKQRRRNRRKKRRRHAKKLDRLHTEELPKIKSKHTKSLASVVNLKYAFAQKKFGDTYHANEEQVRFTPMHRRKVFNNFKANADKDSYVYRSYF